MQGLFARIRWRLVGWNMLILGLILILLGTSVYAALSRSLLDEVDRNLFSRSEQAGPLLFPLTRRPGEPGPGGPRPGPEGYNGGTFYLALAPDGAVQANPQQVTTSELTWPQGREPTYATIQLGDGDLARVVLRRQRDGGLLVVGQTLYPEQTALRTLLLVLVGGGLLGLLLSLPAAWFLSGRALIPIQHAFRRQQEFVADASHELRTPLTVLRSSTDLLDQHRDQPLQTNGELFDDLRAEIARMERLAQDLLTLARSDTGGLELMTAPLDIADVASEVVRRTTPLATTKGVQLSLRAENQPSTVEADPDRMQQVFLILIDNAIKHTPAGGSVTVQVRRQGQTAQVSVVDTGTGIAAEHLPRIFDRFYRADRARAHQEGGTGLGLAIARMLVEAHAGQIQLTSTVGVGTQATVSLPLVSRPAKLVGRLGELAAHLSGTSTRQ